VVSVIDLSMLVVMAAPVMTRRAPAVSRLMPEARLISVVSTN
jgi:hypothetical protein